ncbi:MAG: GGDEF domain-containing protein [Bdellovibrionales bacterium]|nr:GGDEF domain-containing protein [Bdellovibrionales bacterium]
MMANIILFDLLPEVESNIKSTFEKKYQLHVTSQFTEVRQWMQKYHVTSVVASTQTNAKVYDLFKEYYPNVGLVLLDNRHKSTKSNKASVQYLAFEPDMQDVEKAVAKVERFGAKRVQLQASKESHSIFEKLYAVEDHGVNTFMQKSVDVLGAYFKADNVYWVEADKINYYAHEMWKVRSMSGHLKNKGRGEEEQELCSLKGATNVDLNKCILSLNEKLGQGWETIKTATFSDPYLVFPVSHKEKTSGFFIIKKPQKYYQYKHNEVLNILSPFLGYRIESAKDYTKTKDMTYVDDLTELYNQRYLPIALDQCISKYEEKGDCFSVLFMDVDHFKKVNDHRGHLTGSKILVEIGKILKENIRSIDYGFRYGGDEFLLILANTDPETANIVAERIRKHVESEVFTVEDRQLQVTMSIGIACYPIHAKNKKEVLEMADKAMYYGKNKSRNIVFMAS